MWPCSITGGTRRWHQSDEYQQQQIRPLPGTRTNVCFYTSDVTMTSSSPARPSRVQTNAIKCAAPMSAPAMVAASWQCLTNAVLTAATSRHLSRCLLRCWQHLAAGAHPAAALHGVALAVPGGAIGVDRLRSHSAAVERPCRATVDGVSKHLIPGISAAKFGF